MALEKPSDAKHGSIFSPLSDALNNDVLLVWAVVFLAWVLTLVATATGQEHWLHYHALIEHHSLSLPLKLLLLVVAWQVMTAAMMLPSTLPMVRLFAKASRGQSQPRLALLIFLSSYGRGLLF
jgi:hypothetical protein